MPDWPKQYHPARYDDTAYVVDESTTAEGYQLTPGAWAGIAAWCGGTRGLDSTGNQALTVAGSTAHLGDYVMLHNGQFSVAPADGHYQRWAPA